MRNVKLLNAAGPEVDGPGREGIMGSACPRYPPKAYMDELNCTTPTDIGRISTAVYQCGAFSLDLSSASFFP